MTRIPAALVLATALCLQASAAQVRVASSGPGFVRLAWEAAEACEQRQGASCLVGLPLEGGVELQVVEARSRRAPQGAWPAATDGAAAPCGPACLGAVGMLRGQRVAEVVLAPQRQEDGGLLLYDHVVVDVRFRAPPGGGSPAPDPWGEDVLRQVVANYEQARPWRQQRRRAAARPALLAWGPRLRIAVREEGIYRLTGADLEAAGVSLQDVDPQHLRLLYGGGLPLPEAPAGPAALPEVPCVVEDGGDGRLDGADAVVFYAQAASRWTWQETDSTYRYLNNLYTRDNVYWLELEAVPARQAAARSSGALGEDQPYRPESYPVRVHEESEEYIQVQTFSISSGYEWYWEDFRGNARAYRPLIHQPAPDSVTVRLRFLYLDKGKDYDYLPWHPALALSWNEEPVGTLDFVSSEARVFELGAAAPVEGLNQLRLDHQNTETARLDWYELEYARSFAAQQGELFFDVPAHDGVVEYRLSGFAGEVPHLFRVWGPLAEVVDFQHDAAAGTLVFQQPGGAQPQRYAAVVPSRWKRPLGVELVLPQDVLDTRGAEYLIVTHADFRAAAERLAAWRARDDRFGPPLSTRVVDIQDLYDAFSGGLVDPAALRNFIAWAYREWETPPFFVLLLGDAVYDYKNNSGTSPGNWVPAYQDGDSTYDEWFVRVEGDDVFPDLAIGRLPVQTAGEAERVVDKLIDYDRQVEAGPWQSRILLIADDLVNPEHPEDYEAYFLTDAEYLARNLLPEDLDLNKLYLARYPLEGRTKPRAQAEFLRRLNEGALIVTFLGHGNPNVLAHELMFVVSRDLGSIANGGRLPLFYTAASQVGVFDDPVRDSMPEALLKLDGGGVIGMISATRVGYHETNMILANFFHRQMYRSGRQDVPLGQALMEAKRLAPVHEGPTGRRNVQRYSLFGDPVTRLARPRSVVRVEVPDSLRALEEVRVQGQVLDPAGNPAADLEGRALVQAFDSAAMSELDGIAYRQAGAPLFRGYVPVEAGRFTAAF
ncbi:MAG: C25 family cysteine peptidase, partial [Candidatus Latescibacterota bacterium]